MGNCWVHTNKIVSIAGTVISPSSAATLYPKTNLYDNNPASVFRTTAAAGIETIDFDFLSATAIDTVAIANPNFRSSSIIKIQWGTLDNGSVFDVEETINVSGLGNDPAFENLFHKLASTISKRYFRLSISDIGNPDGYYEVGEIWLSVRVTPAQDWEINWSQNFPDTNVVHKTEYLHSYSYIRDTGDIRMFSVNWTGITAATVAELRKLKRAIKSSGYPFWICPIHTSNPPEAFLVRMMGDLEIVQQTAVAWQARGQFEELPRGQTLPT